MEKNGRIGVLIGVGIALAIGLGYWVSRDGDSHDDGAPRLAAGPRGNGPRVAGSIGFGPGGGEQARRAARVPAGGSSSTPASWRRCRPSTPPPQGRTRPPVVDLPRGDAEESEHSAGWRLGQTRHHLEIVQPRIAHMQELIRGFEERGDTAAAEQQRRDPAALPDAAERAPGRSKPSSRRRPSRTERWARPTRATRPAPTSARGRRTRSTRRRPTAPPSRARTAAPAAPVETRQPAAGAGPLGTTANARRSRSSGTGRRARCPDTNERGPAPVDGKARRPHPRVVFAGS